MTAQVPQVMDKSTMMAKSALRKKMNGVINSLSKNEIDRQSELVTNKVNIISLKSLNTSSTNMITLILLLGLRK